MSPQPSRSEPYVDPPPAESACTLAADVASMVGGDRDALARVYRVTARWVYGLGLKMLADADGADELTVAVYRQVWSSAATFNPKRGSVSSWVLAIARSRALDVLRERRRAAQREEDLQGELVAIPDREPTPDARAELADRSARIQSALRELPASQREVVEMAFFEGVSHCGIAARLDQPLGTVKSRMRSAIRRLADSLRSMEAGR